MPTLQAYRRATAAALDDLAVHTVEVGTADTVTISRLVDASPGASTNQHDGVYLYRQRGAPLHGSAEGVSVQVRIGGFVPSTGTLAFDPPWLVPVPTSPVELTHLFPVLPGAYAETDYRTLINRALSKLLASDLLDVPIVPGQTAYSLAAWPWLDRGARLVRILEPAPKGSRRLDASFRRPRVTRTGGVVSLELDVPFEAGTTGALTLDVMRPADTLIRDGVTGVWGERTSGLVLDLDEAAPSVNEVVTAALAEAYYALMSRSPGRPNGAWEAKYDAALAQARALIAYDPTTERQEAAPTAAPRRPTPSPPTPGDEEAA